MGSGCHPPGSETFMVAAIRVENLSKHYRVNRTQSLASYRTLRESLHQLAQTPLRWLRRQRSAPTEDFWALRDVNFEIEPGEVVGIIGRNGAGKSTLLKILSRITRPTEGAVKLRGRVGSLLEVGTGFHPELTGRENIYLNGVILGMKRREVDKKLDAIIEFAEMAQFIDTPVKRYSSGMYVRLAFSVAAHINPEILLVDEVLAVGDLAFQKKCLGQMDAVAKGGRTVILVSHQLETLSSLCPSCLLLERGQLVAKDSTKTIIDRYLASQEQLMTQRLADRSDRRGSQRLRFTDVWVEDMHGQQLVSVMSGQAVKLVICYQLAPGQRLRRPGISLALYTQRGAPVTKLFSAVTATEGFPEDGEELPTEGRFECLIPRLPLNRGTYVFNLMAETGPDGEEEDLVLGAGSLTVEAGDFYGTGKSIDPRFPLLTDHSWRLVR
jgi:lipopolysaccharide transport system ATP-binding protein